MKPGAAKNSLRGRLARCGLMAALMGLMALGGCHKPKPPAPLPEPLSLEEALILYNANALAIGPFSAKIASWEALLQEEKRDQHIRESGGKLFYAPGEGQERARLSLRASASFYDLKALILGSNQEEYWLLAPPQKFGLWGRYQYIGKPCAGRMPLDPHYLLDMTALKAIAADRFSAPYPIYKVDGEIYTIGYLEPSADGLSLQREVEIDRRTDRVKAVRLYDRRGRSLGRSELSDYQPFGDGFVPGQIRLIFLNEQGGENYFLMRLTNFKPMESFHPQLFARPLEPADIEQYDQIDKDCEEQTEK